MKRQKASKEKADKGALSYEGLQLPETLNHILEQDFWMLDNIGGAMLSMLKLPMKFTSFTSIFVRKGRCRAEINLQEYEMEAPCVVNIESSEILQPLEISEDFEGAFVVMSQRFVDDIRKSVVDPTLLSQLKKKPVIKLPAPRVEDFEMFYRHLRASTETATSYIYHAVFHTVMAFIYQVGVKCISADSDNSSTAGHITSRFLKLARENFKKERFMEFYANTLEITPKHLSRTIKAQTGYTASEWLDRMVILEAKVLLKSTSMSIQQIAEELNFASQSFFGKYFKNLVGISPKDYRNS